MNLTELQKAILADLRRQLQWASQFLFSFKARQTPPPAPPLPKVTETTPRAVLNPQAPYDWSSPAAARHSCRVIMDEYNLRWSEKDLLCAVIQGESGFDIHAVGKPNYDGSQDYGIVQMNSKFWIGEGKLFKNPQEVFDDPPKSVRFMVDSYKEGHLKWWIAYKNGSYKKFL